jgi:pyruvate dehydrogenase E1 component beta subunit
MVIRAPFGGNVRTPELHSDAHEAKYVQSPGIKVAMPATAYDAKGLLATALRDPDPVLFCEPLRGYRLQKDEVPDEDYTVPFGEARTLREGSDVTVVAWSVAAGLAARAADEAQREDGISCTVIDLRTLVPFDEVTVVEAFARTGRGVVVHEAPLTSGFGAEIVATVQEQAFWALEAPIERVAAPDVPYPIGSIEESYVPDLERVRAAIRRVAEVA